MNVFDGVTTLPVDAGDIITSGLALFQLLWPLLLIGLALVFAPRIAGVVKRFFGGGKSN